MASPYHAESYAELLDGLRREGDVEYLTYDDLAWGSDFDYKQGYPDERSRWTDLIRSATIDPKKRYLLLQHDTDSGPAQAVAMGRLEQSYDARSSIMTFARWSKTMQASDVVDYPIDWAALVDLQHLGFCVGYHCNALHVSGFDDLRVYEQFDADVDALVARGLRIDFFSPHGGKASASGALNVSFDYPAHCSHRLRWVHNKHSPSFDGYFSDGGLAGQLKSGRPAPDLSAFVRAMIPGCRYRALIHPQYYRFGPQ